MLRVPCHSCRANEGMPPRYAEPGTKRSIAARLPPRSPCFRASPHQSWRENALASIPGQDLERMPMGLSHDLEDLLYVGAGNVLVEEVANRVDEDHSRARPLQRLLQPLWPELERKPCS